MNGVQAELQKVIPGYNTFYLIAAFAVVSFVLIALTRASSGTSGKRSTPRPKAMRFNRQRYPWRRRKLSVPLVYMERLQAAVRAAPA